MREPFGAYDIKIRLENDTGICNFYWKMIVDISKLVIIVNFPTSLVIKMKADGSDL